MNYHSALRQYQNVGVKSSVTEADPHTLIRMLFDGALERLSVARGAIERGEAGRKGEALSRVIAIVDTLRVSLDLEGGDELAANLQSLYEYMTDRLVEANRTDRTELVTEVASLLRELREAWVAIPEAYRSPVGAGASPIVTGRA
jgi:flagellar protein FliS